jgi:hypothetical protein
MNVRAGISGGGEKSLVDYSLFIIPPAVLKIKEYIYKG